jgi:hypothetical protein
MSARPEDPHRQRRNLRSDAALFYTPDFFVRSEQGHCYLVETKGREDKDVPRKAKAAIAWCEAASTPDCNRDGEVVEKLPFEQIMTSWDRLHQIIRATIPDSVHHLDHDLVAVEQTPDGVIARFANGRVEHGDILIGADGYRSAVRYQYLPDIQPIYAGYVIWRGVAEERDIPATAHQAIFDKLAFYLPPYNKVIGYPIAGHDNDLRPGHRLFNWVLSSAAGLPAE